MGELVTLSGLLEKFGIPVIMLMVVLYFVIKYVPDFLEMKKEEHKAGLIAKQEQLEYYQNRQESYDDQMKIIIKVAEQSSQMIGQASQVIMQSSEVIRMNTEAIKNNTMMHDKVVTALGNDLEALRLVCSNLKEHDQRAEQINNGVLKLLERVGAK